MPKGIPTAGKRKTTKVRQVGTSIRLPPEVIKGLTYDEKRNAILTAFRAKIK